MKYQKSLGGLCVSSVCIFAGCGGDGQMMGASGGTEIGTSQSPAVLSSSTGNFVDLQRTTANLGAFEPLGQADIALTGGTGWNSIPVASRLTVYNLGEMNNIRSGTDAFGGWAATPGVKILSGDFNGDGFADIALTGVAGWNSIPIAFSNHDGTFHVTNTRSGGAFPSWAAMSGVQAVVGDFNHDNKDDIALAGNSSWNTVPVAFSVGDGTFTVTNTRSDAFAALAATSGVKLLSGDFDANGSWDLALTGPPSWNSIPVAFGGGDGLFFLANIRSGTDLFGSLASKSGVKVFSGDFDGDGDGDIALVGGAGWNSIPIAHSNRDGTFGVTNQFVGSFATWAADPSAKLASGDFNHDGRSDIALVSSNLVDDGSIDIAAPRVDGTFELLGVTIGGFGALARTPGVAVISGH